MAEARPGGLARATRDAGTATAELAVALPAVVMALAAVLSVGQAVVAQIRCVDAARSGARAAARGDPPATVRGLALAGMEGAAVSVQQHGALVSVSVSRPLTLLLPRGPVVRLEGRAVAQAEQPATAERGSATILALAAVLVALVLATAGAAMGSAVVARHQAAAAADLGALAAADVLLARAAGDPCVAAGVVVRAQGAVLKSCAVVGADAVVRTSVRPQGRVAALGSAVASARAGPAAAVPGAG